ncbi:metalloregulator ArsR/SmtB family transcription factor [Pontiellaceae bacterium B1224]|nr:metalloregulator ArsR/SmtB family transcription factor [Pontiellaceae bacterium B1224]
MKTEIVPIGKALGDASRLRILMCLEGTTLCQCQLTEILGLAPSTVSQHVNLLLDAGLMESRKEGRWHYYSWALNSHSGCVREALDWVRVHAADDPQVKADAAKRAVVMLNSDTPCPVTSKTRVLFLCTGNSCRSQMAEALLRSCSGGRFEAYSAGLDPHPVHELTYEVMAEIGIDIRGQVPTDVMEYLGRVHFGYLITVCANADNRCPIFPGITERLNWALPDPAAVTGTKEEQLQAFRQTRDELRTRITNWLSDEAAEDN